MLITLGIIGVVAAMTMPSLVANYQKKQIVTQLKKSYTELTQAVKMAELEHGDCDGWDYNLGAKTFYDTYLKGQFNKTNEIKYSEYKNIAAYKTLNGTPCSENWCSDGNSYYILLSNGSILGFSNHLGGNYKSVTVDINGYKKPNITGKDYFVFTIQGEYGVAPYGFANTNGIGYGTDYNRESIKTGHYRACNKANTGVWCSGLIMSDGWEIKDDYPW